MESFMSAPVGVFAEEAGDAVLYFAPHPNYSIPAQAAGSKLASKNRVASEMTCVLTRFAFPARFLGMDAHACEGPALLLEQRTAKDRWTTDSHEC